MTSRNSGIIKKEQKSFINDKNVQTSAPIYAFFMACLSVVLLITLPSVVSFCMALAFPLISIINFIIGVNKPAVRASIQLRAEVRSNTIVFGGLALVVSIVYAAVLAVLQALFAKPTLSWEYSLLIAGSFFLYSLGLIFWKLTTRTIDLMEDTATKIVTYMNSLRSIAYSAFALYAITQYLIGGNNLANFVLICLVSIPTVLFMKESILFKLLGYHPSDRW